MEREYRAFPAEVGRDSAHADVELPVMQRVLELPRGKDVLEVGCGAGSGLGALAALLEPRRLAGLDIDREALSRVRAPAEVFEADVRALPFPDASFDLVFDFGTLWHIARTRDALVEIARVLRPGGYFVHETKLNQLASHPLRSLARRVPWSLAASLRPLRSTLLWGVRVRA
jgi:ubiquinone/menaquinone biosynthesis C-methylase UbiE